MKTYLKFALLATAAVLMYMTEFSPRFPSQGLALVKEAQAILGVRRRSVRRGVIIGSSMAAAGAASASAAAAPTPAPAPAATAQPAGAPPIGSIVSTLPAGCVTSPQGGIQYFNCNGVFYRAAFQGDNLVYVVTQP